MSVAADVLRTRRFPGTPFSAEAIRADAAVLRAAHPVAFPLVRGLDRLGPVRRVPGLGVVVNDPDLMRAVLVDTANFRKDGPGSPGELWEPVVGPRALTNLEGAEHRRLRGALTSLVTPAWAQEVVHAAGRELLADTAARLAAGEEVDVAVQVRGLVGAVVSALVGAPADPASGAELVRRGEGLTGRIGLRTRRLSPADVAEARDVLGGLTGPAARAWERADRSTAPGRLRELGVGLDDARGVAGVLFLTGTETMTSYLPRLAALLADSGLLSSARRAELDARLDAVLDEALRVTAPTPVTVRRAAAEAPVGPLAVREGERVLVLTLNAAWSRRPRPRPAADLKQQWFGAGPHFCLGRPIALAEARALVGAFGRALDAGPADARLVVERRRPRRRVLIPAWESLVLRLVRRDGR